MIKKYNVVIGIVLIILALVVIRSTGNKFRPDAMKHAEAAFNGSNIITSDQAAGLEGKGLLIVLDNTDRYRDVPDAVSMEPGSVLERGNLKMIRHNKGPVILFSGDPSVSAGVWMVLSQLGIRNVYILSETKDDETMKHEFRPGTVSQPEF